MAPNLVVDIEPRLFMSLICVLNVLPCMARRQDGDGAARLLGLATLAYAVGMPLLLFKEYLPRMPVVVGGNCLVLAAMGMLWHVSARLAHRVPPPWTLGVAPLLWLLLWLLPAFAHRIEVRIAVASVLTGGLVVLATVEIARSRIRRLPQGVLLVVGCLHVAVSVMRLLLAVRGDRFAATPLWILVTELNALCYLVLWPALSLLLLNQRAVEHEAWLGRHDELTGVLNRRGLLHAAATQAGSHSVILFDVDRFKRINDTYGHAAGDAAIVAFTTLARDLLGPAVAFGRMGGEEFVALLPAARRDEALRLANRVREAFGGTILPCGEGATVSAGIAHPLQTDPGEPLGMQFGRADRALYRAKRLGRNRVELDGAGEFEAAPGLAVPRPDAA